MSRPAIHPFYRIWFTTVDPIVLVLTIVTIIFSPSTILQSVLPSSIEAYRPMSHGPLLQQSAALYGFMAIIFGVLLRATSDLTVWRIVQAATLAVDLALLVVLWALLKEQGRLSLGDWRAGDWGNFGFTAWVALIRMAFLWGWGVERDELERGKKTR